MKRLTVSTLLVLLNSLYLYSFSGAGYGTESDPYQITNVQQLQEMDDDRDAHYILMNDIDASDTKNWNIGDHDDDASTPDSAMGFDPIGKYNANDTSFSFSGSFNGANYEIKDLYINRPKENEIGLFGYTYYCEICSTNIKQCFIKGAYGVGGLVGKSTSYIKNVSVEGYIHGIATIGGLVGHQKYNKIDSSFSSVQISGLEDVGGLVGYSQGSILNSYTSASVSGFHSYAGGLVGRNYGNISDSYSIANVTSNNSNIEYIGGLAGYNYATIVSSYSSGTVQGDGDYIGGLVGLNYSKISNSYSSCNVRGFCYVGGLVGYNNDKILYSYFSGTVSSTSNGGGLVGRNDDIVSCSYSSGEITGTNISIGGLVGTNNRIIDNSYSMTNVTSNSKAGGLVGSNNHFVMNCYSTGQIVADSLFGGLIGLDKNGTVVQSYWDLESSNVSASAGGIGVSTNEMKSIKTYKNWDLDSIWNIDSGINLGYPILLKNNELTYNIPFNGEGTVENPYQISNLGQLQALLIFYTSHCKLVNDIDASESKNMNNGLGFFPIYFKGSLDGNGYSINDLFINRPEMDEVGLFGSMEPNSVATNIKMSNCDISGGRYVGSLVGLLNEGQVTNSYSSGKISGHLAGGLIGSNKGLVSNSYSDAILYGWAIGGLAGGNSGIIENSHANGNLYASDNICGGLVGGNTGEIDSSFACGTVNGIDNVGGLVGRNYSGKIKNSFSTGDVFGRNIVGGLLGNNYLGYIEKSFSTGRVEGSDTIGGLVGCNLGVIVGKSINKITDSYTISSVKGNSYVGGLVGLNYYYGAVYNSYAVVHVEGNQAIGGLAGHNDKFHADTIMFSFWDIEMSEIDSSAGGMGKTTAEMKTKSTFTDADWDFDTIWAISPDINDGYPYFQWMEDIVGVEELPVMEMQLIKAYPNPVDNYLHISCPLGLSGTLNVRISDAAGNLVRDMDVVNINNELTVPVDGLSAGAYYMNIISGGEVYSVKFVVE